MAIRPAAWGALDAEIEGEVFCAKRHAHNARRGGHNVGGSQCALNGLDDRDDADGPERQVHPEFVLSQQHVGDVDLLGRLGLWQEDPIESFSNDSAHVVGKEL
jgi:hypothetical protein